VVYTKEAAKLVKVSINQFREMVKRGEIKAKVRGDRLLFLVSELEDYLQFLPDYKPGDSITPKHLRRLK
jgi:excisionase family DNA binding protein